MAPKASRRSALSSTADPRPSGPPMSDRHVLGAGVAPGGDAVGKAAAVQAVFRARRGRQHRARGNRGKDSRSLLVLPGDGIPRAAFGDLAAVEAEAELTSGAVGTVAVAVEELAFRAGLEASDGNDGHLHGVLRLGAADPARRGTRARAGSVVRVLNCRRWPRRPPEPPDGRRATSSRCCRRRVLPGGRYGR